MAEFRLNVEEAFNVSNQIKNLSDQMAEQSTKIINNCNSLLSDYGLNGATTVNSLVGSITDKLGSINGKMSLDFKNICTFINKQFENYDEVFKQAQTKLQGALDLINKKFGARDEVK